MLSKQRTNIIIDTDPGVDDALAILFASFAPQLRVQAITSVYGNQALPITTRNACAIVDLLGAATRVYPGAAQPLQKKAPRASSHGESGIGEHQNRQKGGLKRCPSQPMEERAVSYLTRSLQSGTSIACLGPLTTIATLARTNPSALDCVETLVIMGGVFDQPGNVTPYAEFNAYCDPDALSEVLNFTTLQKVLIPANVCREVTMDEKDFAYIENVVLRDALRDIIRDYVRYYRKDHIYGGYAGGVMYDVLVIAYLLWPELFSVEPRVVRVDTSDGPTRGMTTVDAVSQEEPNCLLVSPRLDLPLGVNPIEIKRRLLQLLRVASR